MIDPTNAPRLNDTFERASLIVAKLTEMDEKLKAINTKLDSVMSEIQAQQIKNEKIEGGMNNLRTWVIIAVTLSVVALFGVLYLLATR